MNGLVLAGGRSTRMGRDKAALVYPAVSSLPVAVRLHGLLSSVCDRVLLSMRTGQKGFSGLERVDDSGELGPAGGLLAAFGVDARAPWLVVACDYPYANEVAVRHLAYHGGAFLSDDGFPDPLFALWTPAMMKALAADVAGGQTSPRRTLERLGIVGAECPWPDQVRNINTATEAAGLTL
jgi:molybdopterin-guanine dinucleotide biosynthesis protein A